MHTQHHQAGATAYGGILVQAILFEGPPGTGKTTCARIVAGQASIPLVYIPVESIASRWYGESEKKLSSMLSMAEDMGGCIIFVDEVCCSW
jgi:SpoVK/Ycf46/Vps4 family AAA+-type ATPase